ncbi:hypothetical protein DFJ74DRAFT_477454 [Hyaloraphidium curvatum]|nr:hypothetical protein DFJ74DRAFT_477454 [Hyaloraphidium curvatum]
MAISTATSGTTLLQAPTSLVPIPAQDPYAYARFLSDLAEALREAASKQGSETQLKGTQSGCCDVKNWWKERKKSSPLLLFISGHDYTPEDTDWAINGMALVNALLLTIPFSVATGYTHDYWDWLRATFIECYPGDPATADQRFTSAYRLQVGGMFGAIIASGTTLLMCTVYYLMRPPKSAKPSFFLPWWRRARWIFAVIVICSAIADVMIAMMTAQMRTYFTSNTEILCDAETGNDIIPGGAIFLIGTAVVVGFPTICFFVLV